MKRQPKVRLKRPLSLEEAFGAVKPLTQPEDFKRLHDLVVEDRLEAYLAVLKRENEPPPVEPE